MKAIGSCATLASLLLLGGAFVACSDSSDPQQGNTGDNNSNAGDGDGDGDGNGSQVQEGALKILFTPMYSAYDGVHDFKVPVKVENVSGVTFTASEEGYVDIDPTEDGAMLTMRKAGTVEIIAQAGNLRGRSTLTITQATPQDYELGSDRYNNGVGVLKDAGAPDPDAGAFQFPEFDPNASCSNCHGEGAMALDIEHTPQQIAGYSDEELIKIFTEGTKPEGVGIRNRLIPQFLWSMLHKWEMSDAEKKGIVVYLRSLPPKSQGPLDFGGIMRPGGGFPGGGNPGGGNPGGGDTDPGTGGGDNTGGDADAGAGTAEDAGS